jgi:hypothetical protein
LKFFIFAAFSLSQSAPVFGAELQSILADGHDLWPVHPRCDNISAQELKINLNHGIEKTVSGLDLQIACFWKNQGNYLPRERLDLLPDVARAYLAMINHHGKDQNFRSSLPKIERGLWALRKVETEMAGLASSLQLMTIMLAYPLNERVWQEAFATSNCWHYLDALYLEINHVTGRLSDGKESEKFYVMAALFVEYFEKYFELQPEFEELRQNLLGLCRGVREDAFDDLLTIIDEPSVIETYVDLRRQMTMANQRNMLVRLNLRQVDFKVVQWQKIQKFVTKLEEMADCEIKLESLNEFNRWVHRFGKTNLPRLPSALLYHASAIYESRGNLQVSQILKKNADTSLSNEKQRRGHYNRCLLSALSRVNLSIVSGSAGESPLPERTSISSCESSFSRSSSGYSFSHLSSMSSMSSMSSRLPSYAEILRADLRNFIKIKDDDNFFRCQEMDQEDAEAAFKESFYF